MLCWERQLFKHKLLEILPHTMIGPAIFEERKLSSKRQSVQNNPQRKDIHF